LAKHTWEATWGCIKWSERTKRTFSFKQLKANPPVSDWVPFVANYIINIASNNVSRKAVYYKHGTYDPQPNKNNKDPLGNIHMITSAKLRHQVDCIENLRVNASSVPPIYNSLQLSSALFTTLEERNFDTSSNVTLPARMSGELMIIYMAKGNIGKDKGKPKKTATKMNKTNAIQRTDAQAAASDIATMVKTLQSTLMGKSEYKNDNALQICDDLSDTILQFANHASPVHTDDFTSTDDYLASFPSHSAYSPTLKDLENNSASGYKNSKDGSQSDEDLSDEGDSSSEVNDEDHRSRQSEQEEGVLNRAISKDFIQQPRETMTNLLLLSFLISLYPQLSA